MYLKCPPAIRRGMEGMMGPKFLADYYITREKEGTYGLCGLKGSGTESL